MSKPRILRINNFIFNLSKFYAFWTEKDGSDWILYGAIPNESARTYIMKFENKNDAERFLNNLMDQLTSE